jgi:hypothetical protein
MILRSCRYASPLRTYGIISTDFWIYDRSVREWQDWCDSSEHTRWLASKEMRGDARRELVERLDSRVVRLVGLQERHAASVRKERENVSRWKARFCSRRTCADEKDGAGSG